MKSAGPPSINRRSRVGRRKTFGGPQLVPHREDALDLLFALRETLQVRLEVMREDQQARVSLFSPADQCKSHARPNSTGPGVLLSSMSQVSGLTGRWRSRRTSDFDEWVDDVAIVTARRHLLLLIIVFRASRG